MQSQKNICEEQSSIRQLRRVSRCRFSFLVVLILLFCLVMTGGCQLQVDEGQQCEDECLHEGNKQFKWNKDHIRDERQQEGEDCKHDAACKNVAKETEGQREYA